MKKCFGTLIINLIVINIATVNALVRVPEDQRSIQRGIDNTRPVGYDTVSVWLKDDSNPTYYREHINFRGKNILVVNRSYIENIQYFPSSPDYIIVDGGFDSSGVYFTSGEDSFAILRGFTIQNGTGENNANTEGGGILCVQSSPKIEDNIVTDNWGAMRGGCIAIRGDENSYELPRPIIFGNVIRDNGAYESGGGIFYTFAKPIITNNEIVNNYCENGVGGGISGSNDYNVYTSYKTLIISNRIDSNYAENSGRALAFGESDAIIRNNLIRHNNQPNSANSAGIGCPSTVDFGDAYGATGPGYNWIEDNGSYDISSSGEGLLAEGNYWGTLNTPDIRNRINPYSGSIDFDPIAASDRITSVNNYGQCSTNVIVTGDLTVGQGKTLTIAPGNTFSFATTDDYGDDGLCELIVNGELTADGNVTKKISFTSFASSPQAGDWYGVTLESGSTGNFDNCIIQYAYSGIDATEGSGLVVDSSTIEYNQVYGIKIGAANSAEIRRSEINSSIYGIYSNQTNSQIEDNELWGNSRYGIILINANGNGIARNRICGSTETDASLYGIDLG